MNVAMFTDAYYPRINGVSVSVHSYAEELHKNGHSVCIVCSDYKEKQFNSPHSEKIETEDNGLQILRLSSFSLFISNEDRLARLENWFIVKKCMDDFAPDVIHVNSEFVVGYFGVMYAKHRLKPLVYTFHTMWEDYVSGYLPGLNPSIAHKISRSVLRFYLKAANEIIVPTKRIDNVVKKYGILQDTNLLPTGVSRSLFTHNTKKMEVFKTSLRDKKIPFEGKQVLLYVGRVVFEKNIDFLLKVISMVVKVVPDAILVITGDGPDRGNLEKKVKEKGLGAYVFFTGYVAREDLQYIYRLAKLFVFPSKTETQGLVTIESMLCGTPVIAIGEMGTIDVMQGNNGGFMVRDDIDEFCELVLLMLTNEEVYNAKKEEALEWGKSWLIESLTPQLIAIYSAAIKKRLKTIN